MRQSWTISIFWTGNENSTLPPVFIKLYQERSNQDEIWEDLPETLLPAAVLAAGEGFNYLIINPNQLDRDFNFPWTMLLPNCVRAVLGQILFLAGYQIWSTLWPWYASYWFSDQEERNDKCRNVRKKYRKILPTIWKCNDTFLFLRDIGRGFVRL